MRRRFEHDRDKAALHVQIARVVYEALDTEVVRRRRRDFVTSKAEIVEQALRWYLEIALPRTTYQILDAEVARRWEAGEKATRAGLISEAIHALWGGREDA